MGGYYHLYKVDFIIPIILTIIALLIYFVFTYNVGSARVKYKIKAPKTTGNSNFERIFRVQQNTMEQLVLFIPLLWITSYLGYLYWATFLGFIWILSRIVYAYGYYKNEDERTTGAVIGVLIIATFFLTILYKIVRVLF